MKYLFGEALQFGLSPLFFVCAHGERSGSNAEPDLGRPPHLDERGTENDEGGEGKNGEGLEKREASAGAATPPGQRPLRNRLGGVVAAEAGGGGGRRRRRRPRRIEFSIGRGGVEFSNG